MEGASAEVASKADCARRLRLEKISGMSQLTSEETKVYSKENG